MKDHPRQEPSQRRDFNGNDKATQQVLRVLDSAWLLDPINRQSGGCHLDNVRITSVCDRPPSLQYK